MDLSRERPLILRPGYVTLERLSGVLPEITADTAVYDRPLAPGMKYRHYAPKGRMVVYSGSPEALNARLDESVKTAVLCREEHREKYKADLVFSLGTDAQAAALALYRLLRECDRQGVEQIYAEPLPEEGLGAAVMNRLLKAAGYQREDEQ